MVEVKFGQVVGGNTFELTFPKTKFSDVDFVSARASCPKCIKTVVYPNKVTIILTTPETKGPNFKVLNLYDKAGDQVNKSPIVVRWITL